jgi:hypothetical protein
MSPVATRAAEFWGGACPTPKSTVSYTGNYTTCADANRAKSGWERANSLLLAEHSSAQKQADTYRAAAEQHAGLKTGLAVGLPLLNAAALFHAATVRNDHSDFVPGVGFGSAAALGVGGLLSSPSREAIYLQAQAATLCSMSAFDVYLIDQVDYKTYLSDDKRMADRQGLMWDIRVVQAAVEDLKAAEQVYDEQMLLDEQNADALLEPDSKFKSGHFLAWPIVA